MGGSGSGRQGGAPVRRTTDDALPLDIRLLAKGGALAPGFRPVTWTKGALTWTIGVWGGADGIVLDFRVGGDGGRRVRERVAVERTPCYMGGARPWFRCPGCARRVAILYGRCGPFRCRGCHDLAYPSTRKPAWVRQLRIADQLRAKLGADVVRLGPLPPPPPRMRLATYASLVRQIVDLEMEALAGADRAASAMEQAIRRLSPEHERR